MLRVVSMIRKSVFDGKPCDGKLSCTVWDGGKGGDNTKTLPIVIEFAAVYILRSCSGRSRGYLLRFTRTVGNGNRIVGVYPWRGSVCGDGVHHLPRHDSREVCMGVDEVGISHAQTPDI